MNVSEQLDLLENSYGRKMTPNWVEALHKAEKTVIYPDGEVLTYLIDKDVCIINSATPNDSFRHATKKLLYKLINKYDKLIIPSSRYEIVDMVKRLELSYNSEYKFFSKGIF